MKKITSLILAMAMVFSLSAQVFALNDDNAISFNYQKGGSVTDCKRINSIC